VIKLGLKVMQSQTPGPHHLSMTQLRGRNSSECHLLTLIVVALNGKALQSAILRNEVCVAAAPEGWAEN
jgi:hypothetical protein